jgi:hypothetical protein
MTLPGVSVPLLWPIDVVIYRLDIQATWAEDPPGAAHDKGYDPILGEPVISRGDAASRPRTVPRKEHPPIRVPCQKETVKDEELNMATTGDDPLSTIRFVAHRADLERLGLLDPTTRNCVLKKGDRISHLERKGTGVMVKQYQKPLYVYRVDDGSDGFGFDNYDLHIIWTWHRPDSAEGT